MDFNYFISGGIVGGIIVVTGIFYKLFNHRRCKSSCNKHSIEISLDINDTREPTPVATTSTTVNVAERRSSQEFVAENRISRASNSKTDE